MPRAKGGRRVDTRAERGADEQPKVAPSPKTPKQTVRGKRLRVSFSEEDQVHRFSVLQGDLDERREHWRQILDAAALYNSDEDDAFDESDDEETLDSASCAFAAATGTASMKADPEPLNSGPQRRSSVAAGINDDEAPRPKRWRRNPPPLSLAADEDETEPISEERASGVTSSSL